MRHPTDPLLQPDETLVCRPYVHWWFNLRAFGLRNIFERTLVTDRRVIAKSGIFAVEVRSITLQQVETCHVAQSLWGRIFRFGNITLHGSGGQMLEITDICAPLAVARTIGRTAAMRRAMAGMGTPAETELPDPRPPGKPRGRSNRVGSAGPMTPGPMLPGNTTRGPMTPRPTPRAQPR